MVKVDPPETGDLCRRLGPFVKGQAGAEQSLVHLYLNTGKKSITLDVESAQGQEIARALAKEASVVVESFTPGSMAALGLSYKQLSLDYPGLVMTSVTVFERDGPSAATKAGKSSLRPLAATFRLPARPTVSPCWSGATWPNTPAGNQPASPH